MIPTRTEQALIDAWSEVLRREVGLDDDFFTLGGNSLMAVRMAAMLYERLGVEAPLEQLPEHRTPAAFARVIDGAADAGPVEEGEI